jgi:hypothetical protein
MVSMLASSAVMVSVLASSAVKVSVLASSAVDHGLSLDRVNPKTIKLVFVASPLRLVGSKSGYCVRLGRHVYHRSKHVGLVQSGSHHPFIEN